MRRLSSWLPPLAWMAIVLGMSGDPFGAAETGALLTPLFRWLLPWATPAQLAALHAASRKLAHLTEYAILALLWYRALRREDMGARAAAWTALPVAMSWALLDEYVQSGGANRTGSVVDVVIDATGATAALTVVRRDWRRVVDVTTAVLLWTAAGGGVIVLAVDALAGVVAIAPWVTTPAAAVLLLLRRRCIAATRPDRRGATAPRDRPPR